MEKQIKGKVGEDHILKKLEKEGYRLLHRNFFVRGGEIDLVLEKKQRLVFVEVKTRSSDHFGSPFDSITAQKKRHLRRAAELYIQQYHLEERDVEFWAAAVYMDRDGKILKEEFVYDVLA